MRWNVYSIIALLVSLCLLAALLLLSRLLLRKGLPRRIALSGLGLPVLVGIAVRQYLASVGKPVMPWSWVLSWFYNPGQLIALVVMLAYWDVPFLLIAALAARRPPEDARNRILVLAGYIGTFASSVLVFAYLWRNVEAVVMGAPLIPLAILPGTLLGLTIGWLLARLTGHRPG